MKKIIIKETDRFYSRKKKNKYISEYLVYVNVDGNNIACEIALGDNERAIAVHEFALTYFQHLDKYTDIINYIEEITNYKY